jgi:hypothetical protein
MSETNSYKKATDSTPVRVLSLTDAQLIQIELALDEHILDLEGREDADTFAESIEAAREALRLVQGA